MIWVQKDEIARGGDTGGRGQIITGFFEFLLFVRIQQLTSVLEDLFHQVLVVGQSMLEMLGAATFLPKLE